MVRRISVGLGLMGFPFSGAEAYWRWVDLCEESGVDSIWQTDRLISSEPYLESLTSLAALAGRTRRLKFGMNVLSLGQRDPVLVAKQCATIDMLSGGRLLPAFGVGSDRSPEWAAMNLDAKVRGAKTDEALEIIRRLWAEDKVDFTGKHYQLTGATISPKPAQADLPIWIGGSSPAAIRRTARFGTGWQGGAETPAVTAQVITAIKAALAQYGRTIDEDHYGAGFPFWFGNPDDPGVAKTLAAYRALGLTDPLSYFAIGDATAIVERIETYIAAGISKFVLRPMGEDDAEIIAQTEGLIGEVLPEVARRWPKPGG
jgi:probable F420-dependent oxidoreductase